jgi:hypothetical protein
MSRRLQLVCCWQCEGNGNVRRDSVLDDGMSASERKKLVDGEEESPAGRIEEDISPVFVWKPLCFTGTLERHGLLRLFLDDGRG